ncbi:MAG TPA: DNA polymerase IV, partial [Anseongella sp.]|nr:DNA polymerase IV [Anseongella sp.]
MNRAILHVCAPDFIIAVERLKNPSLSGKSVIVSEGERGAVVACSGESLPFGVFPSMPAAEARKLAPHAIFVPCDMESYACYSRRLTRVLGDAVPVLERASTHEFYADLSEIGGFGECWKWACELRRKVIRETGLPVSTGLSTSKFVSAVAAAHAGPDGEKCIRPGAEKLFLAPLSLQKVPLGDEKSRQLLRQRGILTMGQLAEIPPGTLQRLLGKAGIPVWQKANGICHSAVIPYNDPASFSSEVAFSRSCHSATRLLSLLGSMSDKLSYSLRRKGMAATSVTVKIRYPDFSTSTRQVSLPPATTAKTLTSRAQDLFQLLYDQSRGVR